MEEIKQLLSDPKLLETKKLSQIIIFLGDGKLKNTDTHFKTFLKNITNDLLVRYADECLEKSFPDSGLALQDIVNEIGSRLGFTVTNGLYQGNKNEIGFDGIWRQQDDWDIIIEVKTTDAYRISLDTIAKYRQRLSENNKIKIGFSSMLIIVGRDDTGELEAQIRGSKHAWDIRIISIGSLIQLLKIKESLSDESTAEKISIALRPYEFTRVDRLIDLLFLAIKDVEVEENAEDQIEIVESIEPEKTGDIITPVNFHSPVLEKIKKKLNIELIKNSKSSYSSNDFSFGIVISISKQHPAFNSHFKARYWFAFHPHQNNFLEKYKTGYACYGCGNENTVFMIPFEFLKTKLDFMWKTKNGDKDYKHIVIYQNEKSFFLRTNIEDKEHYDDLMPYKI
jgi:hypothetical protein